MSKAWKSVESTIASLFGGRRVPLSGRNSGHKTSADVMGLVGDFARFYIEIKHGEQCDKKYGINQHRTGWRFKIPVASATSGTGCIGFYLCMSLPLWFFLAQHQERSALMRTALHDTKFKPSQALVSLILNTSARATEEHKIPLLLFHPSGFSILNSYVLFWN